MNGEDSSSKSAPTGCYKCGRPGHWSRDCPNQNPNPNSDLNSNKPFQNSNNYNNKGSSEIEKPKRVPKSRPKLTPELLLSDDGIGFVLKHFPSAFKYQGHGHEVSDLGNLIGLYSEWHSHLIPYYSFDQFVHKVEQVGTTKRVKLCLGGLREKVAHGGDPTKMHDSPVEDKPTNNKDAMNLEEPATVHEDLFNQQPDTENLQDDLFQEMYDRATEVPDPSNLEGTGTTGLSSSHNSSIKDSTNEASKSNDNDASEIARKKQISDEQKARMEANRLKAMEKAAARARSTQVA